MSPNEMAFWIALTGLGVLGSAIFSGLETGCYCVSRVRLIVHAESHDGHSASPGAKRLLSELRRPSALLGTLLISNNVANYIGSLGLAALFAGAGLNDWTLIGVNALLLTPVLFIFGETLPKELFRVEADALTPRLAWLLTLLRLMLTVTLILPIVQGFGALVGRLVREGGDAGLREPRGRVAALLKEGARHGVLSESQTTLIDRAFALRDVTLRDLMLPWRRAATINSNATRHQLEAALRERSFSRWPVVDRRGRVIGVISSLEVWLNPEKNARDLMEAPVKLTPNAGVREALSTLRDANSTIAIVEERDRPVGIIAIKNLLGPVTGSLDDL